MAVSGVLAWGRTDAAVVASTGSAWSQYRDAALPDVRRRRASVIAQVGPAYPFALLVLPLLPVAAGLLTKCLLLLALRGLTLFAFLRFALCTLFAQDLRIALRSAASLLDPLRVRLSAQLVIALSLRVTPCLFRLPRLLPALPLFATLGRLLAFDPLKLGVLFEPELLGALGRLVAFRLSRALRHLVPPGVLRPPRDVVLLCLLGSLGLLLTLCLLGL